MMPTITVHLSANYYPIGRRFNTLCGVYEVLQHVGPSRYCPEGLSVVEAVCKKVSDRMFLTEKELRELQ